MRRSKPTTSTSTVSPLAQTVERDEQEQAALLKTFLATAQHFGSPQISGGEGMPNPPCSTRT